MNVPNENGIAAQLESTNSIWNLKYHPPTRTKQLIYIFRSNWKWDHPFSRTTKTRRQQNIAGPDHAWSANLVCLFWNVYENLSSQIIQNNSWRRHFDIKHHQWEYRFNIKHTKMNLGQLNLMNTNVYMQMPMISQNYANKVVVAYAFMVHLAKRLSPDSQHSDKWPLGFRLKWKQKRGRQSSIGIILTKPKVKRVGEAE